MIKFSINDISYIDFYKENGYIIFSDLINSDELDEIKIDILKIFQLRFNELGELTEDILVRNYDKKEMWRECASKMWDIFGVLRIASQHEVMAVLKNLDLENPIIATRPEVRTDMPKDFNYMQPWHQDWNYGRTSLNSVTLWIPLVDVNESNGTVQIIPKTHKLGILNYEELSNPRRYEINIDALPKGEVINVELKKGECVLFSQMLVHRSGINSSDKPRLTFQGRFADLSDKTYIKNGFNCLNI